MLTSWEGLNANRNIFVMFHGLIGKFQETGVRRRGARKVKPTSMPSLEVNPVSWQKKDRGKCQVFIWVLFVAQTRPERKGLRACASSAMEGALVPYLGAQVQVPAPLLLIQFPSVVHTK